MHTAAADPLIGRTLEGRYRVLDPIARGGMSTVYSAVDERLDRLVAVKVMSAALSADPAFSDRFTREARAAARLSNLNTVSVYDQGTDLSAGEHHVFLVMELVEGRTLRDLIRERGPLPVAQAVSIMEPVLSALAAAHRAGIVHRDVKPENILLSDDGVVKVADFGLARAVESEASATRTGLMMGTVAYCAPEQISKGFADQRSDVYAAGVVLFELLTGSTPYQGESAMTIAYQHVHSRVPAPSSRVPGIPEEIDELVIAATDSDPQGRPRDASAFLAELADLRTALALPVLAVPARQRNAAAGTRANGGSRAAGLSSAAATTTAVVRETAGRHDTSVVPQRRAAVERPGPPPPIVTPPPKRPAQPPRSAAAVRRRRTLVVVVVLALLGIAAGYSGWWFASGRYGSVPNVTGQSSAAASARLREAGYKVGPKVERAFSETIQAGLVMGTDPAAGARKQHGSVVDLVLSNGKERYSIPSVAGATEGDARTALAAIPIQVAGTARQQASDTVPAGKVIGTDPVAGTKVMRASVVTVVVSSGPPIIGIPNIDPGTPADQATQTLKAAGFKVKSVTAFSDTIDKDAVISISPSGQARKFSIITLTVSKGPNIVVVPDIKRGMPVADAEAALTAVGLAYQVQAIGNSSVVLAISPESGTKVKAGTTVTIYAI